MFSPLLISNSFTMKVKENKISDFCFVAYQELSLQFFHHLIMDSNNHF